MKKMFALVMCSLVLTFSAVSAGAYASPSVNGSDVDSSSNSTSTSNNNNNSNNTVTSPKTGNTGVYAVLMAAAAAVFGGVAFGAKRKLKD